MLRREWNENQMARLRGLGGEFALSGGERFLQRAMGVGAMAMGAFGMGTILARYRQVGEVQDLWFVGAIMVAFMGVGAYLLRQATFRYRFSVGVLQRLNGSGRVLWEESLGDITSVERRSSRNGDYLKVQWSRRRRYITLYSALDRALEDPEPKEPLEEEPDGESAEPAGPNWRCAKCGEENPGNFDECWKCETERASTQ
ncbi:MAG TPA: hypothetical protein VK130_04270 [Steroidobacteraceae bacterium]|nr:hypothetical protein [Steroidobacteraceae bacterium]